MGTMCAQTSCGVKYINWKVLKEMNSRGVYTPEQIQEQVDKAWAKINKDDLSIIDKKMTKEIVEQAVNALGAIGDGYVFEEEKFEKSYLLFDSWGLEKIVKSFVIGMVTAMLAKDGENADENGLQEER